MGKLLSARDLRDEGYLQEVNRGFFHPLGLALAVEFDPDNPDAPAVCSIHDVRDDPEGYEFDWTDNASDSIAKANRVRAIGDARAPARKDALGYWQQPLPGDLPITRGEG